MAPYSYAISLRISHPNMDPEEITRILSLTPVRMHKAGDPRQTPKGKQLEGVYKETYWYTQLVPEGERSSGDELLEDFLFEVSEELQQFSNFFTRIRAEEGHIDLFIGTFGNRNYSYELPPKMLKAVGELGIALSFDVYPGI